MTKIQVGDMVSFYDTVEKHFKQGQVVSIDGDYCEVYIIKEAAIYNVAIAIVKKL